MPRGKFDRKKVQAAGDYEMDSQTSAEVERMTAVADAQIEESRVNFRWGQDQVALVKHVAFLMGVPYQTYIKQVLFRQAVEDLNHFIESGIHSSAALKAEGTSIHFSQAKGSVSGILTWNPLMDVYGSSIYKDPSGAVVPPVFGVFKSGKVI